MTSDDERFLERAIALSRESLTGGTGGPFGAVVARGGAVLGEGANQVTVANDPTAHAEVVAIRDACRRIGDFVLAGATIYASCEPCPMCLGAILWARIDRLVYANSRDQAAETGFSDAAFWAEVRTWPAARMLICEHRPQASAEAVFAGWRSKIDRVDY